MRLVHTADWHIGRRFPAFAAPDQLRLARARLDAIDRILAVARAQRADIVLCAGDLFDSADPREGLWREVADRLSVPGPPAVLLPGNHDPVHEGSVYHPRHPFRAALPAWVHVVDHNGFRLELDAGVVVAEPCRSQASDADPTERLPARPEGDDRVWVGLVHGQTTDTPGHETNFPIDPSAAARLGLDYLAVGDTHAFRQVSPAGEVGAIYPGAPEALRFDEADTGWCAVALARRGRRPLVRRERVAMWTWRDLVVRDLEALRQLAASQEVRSSILRLTLDMRLAPSEFDEVEALLGELRGSSARHGSAGMLVVRREALGVDLSGIDTVFEDLPEVIKLAAARIAAQQREQPEIAGRAMLHLYRLATREA